MAYRVFALFCCLLIVALGCSREAHRLQQSERAPAVAGKNDATTVKDTAGSREPSHGGKTSVTDRQLWEALKDGKPSIGDSEQRAEALRVLSQLGAKLTFDQQGNLVAADLAGSRLARIMPEPKHVAALVCFSRLRQVRLYGTGIDGQVVPSLNAMSQLTHLSLEETGLKDEDFCRLHLPKLRSLDVRGSIGLGLQSWKHLASFPALEQLVLVGCAVDDESLKVICQIKNLRLLDLRRCEMISSQRYASLGKLASLQDLRIGGQMVTDEVLQLVGQLEQLRALSVEEASISDAGLQAIAKLPLEQLSVVRCVGVTDEGLKSVAAIGSLKKLTMRDTSLMGDGLEQLANCSQLETLDLSQNFLDCTKLAALSRLPGLKTLVLRQVVLEPDCIRALHACPSLYELDLSGCTVGDDIAAAIGQLRNIRRLLLRDCSGVTETAVGMVAQLQQLEYLDLQGTNLPASATETLRLKLPKCRIVF